MAGCVGPKIIQIKNFDLLKKFKMFGKSFKNILPNGGLMVIYDGTKQRIAQSANGSY